MSSHIVGVQFAQIGKSYHFDASSYPGIKVGDQVIVETSRGRQLGQVTQIIENPSPPPEGWKQVERIATPRDLVLHRIWSQREQETIILCRDRVTKLKLSKIKIIAAEFSFDGTRLTIMYSTETEKKVDLKHLRQDIQKSFQHSHVEFRQVGPRDIARLLRGMGACGLETRCCSRFLSAFNPISIKMAKEQGISLTPQEITGICGRLRCCLEYEYTQYVSARESLPKKNSIVITPMGEGKVIDINPLQLTVRVELQNTGWRDFHRDQLELKKSSEIAHNRSNLKFEGKSKKL